MTKFTRLERQILQAIIDARGVVDRQELIKRFWPDKIGRSGLNCLKVHIHNIRSSANGFTINSIWGTGYVIPDEQRQAAHDAVTGA
jgi:DNA-binding response OmpR family regulator